MDHSATLQSSQQTHPAFSSLKETIEANPLSIAPETSLIDAITLMSQGSLGGASDPALGQSQRSSYALVVADSQLMGIVTERDVVKLATQAIDFVSTPVAAVMTQRLVTLQEVDLQHPFAALSVFRKYRIRHLPILNAQQQVVGVVTPNSVRRALQPSDLFKLLRVEEVMSVSVVEAPPEASVLDLATLMAIHRVSCVVITQPRDATSLASASPLGIVTERDIVQFQALGLSLSALQAQAVMSTPLVCLSPEDTMWKAHQTMARMRVRRLVVTNAQNTLVGIITQTSILASL
ncbi:MAG: CBS domain-containing protein, partial [Cyanobacteria bacterium P01_A01_bin.114]